MKKAQWTDLFREIKKNKGRYLSLLFIVALGTAFYTGIRSAEPDMTSSADKYYDESRFMDVRVLGTLGVTEEDVQAIADTEGILLAEGGYSEEVFALCENDQPILSVQSVCENMNHMTIEEGRMPQAADECFMDGGFMMDEGYEIGDTVTLMDESGEKPGNLKYDTYTIVGSGTWSWYLSWSRGSASIGDGSLDAFMIVQPEAFDMDCYTVIYALVEGVQELNTFSDEYDDAVALVTDRLEEIADERCEIRYAQVYEEAEQTLADAKKEVEDGEQELADAEKQLKDGEAEYEDGKQTYEDGLKEYEDGKKAWEDGKQALVDARKELDDGQAEYEKGVSALKDAENQLAAGQKELDAGAVQIQAAKEELSSGQQELDAGKAELDEKASQVSEGLKACEEGMQQITQAENQLAEKEKELAAGQAAYEEGLKSYEEGAAQLEASKAQLDSGWAQINAAQAQLDQLKEQMEQIKAAAGESETTGSSETSGELESADSSETSGQSARAGQDNTTYQQLYEQLYAQWSEGNAQLEAQRQELEAAQAQYDAAAAELAAAKATLDQTAAQLEAGRTQLEAGKQELAAQKETLVQQQAQLETAQKQIEDGYTAIFAGQEELDAGRQTLQAKEQELKAGQEELDAGRKTIASSKQELADARKQLDDGEKSYADGLQELRDSENQLIEAAQELEKGEKELMDARQELDDGWKEYKEAYEEAMPKLEDARLEIADGEKELAELEMGEWYVLDRDSVQTSVEYGMDSERIGAIGNVFPAIFFLVAALVSLTTMTRMIEEERTLIGTMKALGYGKSSIAAKYILYALSATLAGGVLGVLVGSKIFPYIIMQAYGMLYSNVQYMLLPLHGSLCVFSIALAMLCTVGAAFAACYKELLSMPASLMRPPAPKQGKRVFLEHLPFIWKRLNFSMKSTIRNLVRYKKRFFMTVFGIGGCMALLLVSFGLHDSIAEIVNNQYKNIWTFSASCNIEEDESLEAKLEQMETIIKEKDEIESGMLARQISLDISTEEAEKTAYLFVVEDLEEMPSYLNLHNRISKESYSLTDEGIILTEKLASTLGVSVGDTVTLKISDTKRKEATVTAIAENYLYHYIYATSSYYETLYGEEPEYNELFLKFAEGTDDETEQELAEYLLSQDMVNSVSLVDELQEYVDDMMNALNLVVWVLIIAAALLVFVVLFNLNNINISERRRELASLKVLGFYDMEVAMYVYRENIFLTLFGIIAGVFMGIWLHQYLILTLEVDMIMFGRNIAPVSYLYSILMTTAFTVLVNISMYYKLRQIDMVESLKSVE